MSNYATKDDLKVLSKGLEGKIDKAVGRAVDELSEVIANLPNTLTSVLHN